MFDPMRILGNFAGVNFGESHIAGNFVDQLSQISGKGVRYEKGKSFILGRFLCTNKVLLSFSLQVSNIGQTFFNIVVWFFTAKNTQISPLDGNLREMDKFLWEI